MQVPEDDEDELMSEAEVRVLLVTRPSSVLTDYDQGPTAGPSFTGTGKAKPTAAERQQKSQKRKAAEGKLNEKRQEMDKAKVRRVSAPVYVSILNIL